MVEWMTRTCNSMAVRSRHHRNRLRVSRWGTGLRNAMRKFVHHRERRATSWFWVPARLGLSRLRATGRRADAHVPGRFRLPRKLSRVGAGHSRWLTLAGNALELPALQSVPKFLARRPCCISQVALFLVGSCGSLVVHGLLATAALHNIPSGGPAHNHGIAAGGVRRRQPLIMKCGRRVPGGRMLPVAGGT
jgi:hypothetical protein